MTFLHGMYCGCLAVAVVFGATTPSFSQTLPSPGALTADAPVFLVPDASRTPLTTLTRGTVVRVLKREGDWYQIEFRDSRFGDRTGYIAAGNVQLQAISAPATQPPVKPEAPPPTPSAGSPATPARRPPQDSGARTPKEPVTISFDVGLQTTSREFQSTSTFDRFVESGTLTSTYSGDRPVVFDVAMKVGVWRGLGAGVAVTQASKAMGGDVTAGIPHPFFFNRPRTVTGASPDLTRKEVAVHLDALWTVPASRSTRIAIFAGPSYFEVTQGLVTAVEAAEVYPFDIASFASATTTEETRSRWGFNVGVDVTQRLSRYVGIGMIGRYSRASLTFPIVDTQNVEIEVGGFQVGGGVRLQF